jgi:hypothetical protein
VWGRVSDKYEPTSFDDTGSLAVDECTRKAMKTTIVIVLVVVVLAALTFIPMYHVREDSGGQLLWKGDRAYLFVSVVRRGYRFSYWAYPWTVLSEYLGALPVPVSQRRTLDVLLLTPNTLERHVLEIEGNDPHLFTPFEGHIYANCQGTPCKWNETHFEPATEDEGQKLNGISNLSAIDFTNIGGWSKRRIGAVASDFQFSVELSDQFALLVKQGNVYRSVYDSSSIDMMRRGQPSERLWYVDGNPRQVTKSEYDRTFKRQ